MIYGYLVIAVAVCGIITTAWIKYHLARSRAARLEMEHAVSQGKYEAIKQYNEEIKRQEQAETLLSVKQKKDLKDAVETFKKTKTRDHFE